MNDWKASAKVLSETTELSWREIAKVLGRPKSTVSDYLRLVKMVNSNKPKILFLDLETLPAVTMAFGRFDQNINQDFVLQEGCIVSYSYAWNDGAVHGYILDDFDIKSRNDYVIASDLNTLFNQADIIVAHYGDNFDIKVSNASFIRHGFNPPTFYKTIDTKKLASRYFKFPSNKLDSIGEFLGVGRKIETGGASLWRKVHDCDPVAKRNMLEYNKQDVILLRDVFNKLQSWNKTSPNMNLYNGEKTNGCKNCGSKTLENTGSFVYTPVNRYEEWRCTTCGALNKGGLIKKSVKKGK